MIQVVRTFDEIKRRIIRKENMVKNREISLSSRSLSYSYSRSLVAVKIQPYHELPNKRSDFGMITNRPYIFSNAVFALETILYEQIIKI